MNLDPETCPHCHTSWVGEPTPNDGSHEGSHYTKDVVLILDDPKYYKCLACGAHSELSLWNHGYKASFLADVLIDDALQERTKDVDS